MCLQSENMRAENFMFKNIQLRFLKCSTFRISGEKGLGRHKRTEMDVFDEISKEAVHEYQGRCSNGF